MNIKKIERIKSLLLRCCDFINDEHVIFSMLEKFISFLKGETDYTYADLVALNAEVFNIEEDIEQFECLNDCSYNTEEEREDYCFMCNIHRLLVLLNDLGFMLGKVIRKAYRMQKGGVNEIQEA